MSHHCLDHPEEMNSSYCYPCEKLICEQCQAEHSNHLTEKSSSLQQKTLERLPCTLDRGKKIIPELKRQIELVDTHTDKVKQDVSLLQEQLEARYQVIQVKVKEHYHKLSQELSEFVTKVEESRDEENEGIQGKIKFIEDACNRWDVGNFDEVLDSFKTEKSCAKLVDDPQHGTRDVRNPKPWTPELQVHVTEDDMSKEIDALFGTIQYTVEGRENKSISLSNNTSAKVHVKTKLAFPPIPVTKGHKVSGIIQTSSNDVIIGYSTNKIVHYYDRNAKKQKSKELPFYIQNMTSTGTGKIIASENKGSRVMTIENEKVGLFFDASPCTTFGILYSERCESVFLCCQSEKGGFVYVISHDGKLKEIITEDNDGQALFQKPHRIAEHPSKQLIYVTDSGRKILVAIDKYRTCLFTYSGGPESHNFIPIDVKFCNPNNMMLVSNWKGNSVHQLTEHGTFLSLVLSQADNVLYPTVMLVDCLKRIWISHKEKISVLKYNNK
ncbi:uncharacterized protein LOC125664532 [Ostrea edulis]|uniref:uncharacterized protein LOC125664532 n=1 Tax=Ostrea edulis TaxID=37623 RepID=UPI0024AE8E02|nr:uncharacterized protein LOC125664532 [Ostrea edulis]